MKSLDFLLLISPQKPFLRPFDVFYPFSHQQDKNFLPLSNGGLSLLGVLNEEFEVGFHDLAHFKYLKKSSLRETVENVIKKYNPKIVGLHCYTFNFNGMKETLKYIKEINENIITIAGGQHVTFQDEESIKECNGNLDIVVRGEGEKIIYNLINALIKNKPLKNVRGITTDSFKTVDELPLTTEELNSLPNPLFSAIPIEERKSLIYYPINSSRGCSYRCLFCVNHEFWIGGVRFMDPEKVISTINDLYDCFKHKRIFMDFTDTILPLHLEKFKDLVNLYTSEINQPIYFALTRANYTDDERLMLIKRLIQDVGVLSIGVENGNNEVLRIMRKPSWEKQLQALKNIRKFKMKLTPSWLIGHPGETLSTMVENLQKIDFLFNNKLIDTLIPFIWVPLPGTPPFENPDKYHVKIISYDWDRYDRAIYLPPYHLLDPFDHNKIALSNQQIWAYFLGVISLCNKNSTNFNFKEVHERITFDQFLTRVKNDHLYTLFSPGKDGDINYYPDLDQFLVPQET
ncbi:MAG: B12-binding domain-containing radical SAM protein [Candidatus Helarchaeota archaeon]